MAGEIAATEVKKRVRNSVLAEFRKHASFNQSCAKILYISRWNLRLSSYTLTLFSSAKLNGATSSDNGNIEIYVFLEKYLPDFRYKNMPRISIALAFDFT
jgi:hypothetical protein